MSLRAKRSNPRRASARYSREIASRRSQRQQGNLLLACRPQQPPREATRQCRQGLPLRHRNPVSCRTPEHVMLLIRTGHWGGRPRQEVRRVAPIERHVLLPCLLRHLERILLACGCAVCRKHYAKRRVRCHAYCYLCQQSSNRRQPNTSACGAISRSDPSRAPAGTGRVCGMADPTREAAFDLLTAVLDRRRPLEEALDALPATAPRDRAAAHRLAATVLRRMGTLDAVLEPFLRKAAARTGAPRAAARRGRTAAAGDAAACGRGDRGWPGARPWAGAVRRAGQRGAAPGGRRRAPRRWRISTGRGWIRRLGCGPPGGTTRAAIAAGPSAARRRSI